MFFLNTGFNLKCFIGGSYGVWFKSIVVELRQQIVELLQFLRFTLKSFF